MSKIGRVTPNPNVGKAWGNALGGFKDQPRVAGRFATTSQVKKYAAIKAKAEKGSQIKAGVRRGLRFSPSEGTKKKIYGATGGVVAAALIANRLNPSVSLSRKRIRIGIRPDFKVGPFHGFTSHDIGMERRGDDFIDRYEKSVKKRTSKSITRLLGKDTLASNVAHTAVGLDSAEVKFRGGSLKVDGSATNRRLRFERKNQAVAGAPSTPNGASFRPQGGRKGGAKTVTNTTKGGSGQVKLKNSRPQRRGKKKAKKGSK